jgi:hypothetical protein
MVVQRHISSEGSQSMYLSVRQAAKNPRTSAHVLNKLARSADLSVRLAVADHGNTSSETIMFLTKDISVDLRYALAENHNIDTTALYLLAEDSNPYVVQRANKTLARLAGGSAISTIFPATRSYNTALKVVRA